jgi:hypothetical protein
MQKKSGKPHLCIKQGSFEVSKNTAQVMIIWSLSFSQNHLAQDF